MHTLPYPCKQVHVIRTWVQWLNKNIEKADKSKWMVYMSTITYLINYGYRRVLSALCVRASKPRGCSSGLVWWAMPLGASSHGPDNDGMCVFGAKWFFLQTNAHNRQMESHSPFEGLTLLTQGLPSSSYSYTSQGSPLPGSHTFMCGCFRVLICAPTLDLRIRLETHWGRSSFIFWVVIPELAL